MHTPCWHTLSLLNFVYVVGIGVLQRSKQSHETRQQQCRVFVVYAGQSSNCHNTLLFILILAWNCHRGAVTLNLPKSVARIVELSPDQHQAAPFRVSMQPHLTVVYSTLLAVIATRPLINFLHWSYLQSCALRSRTYPVKMIYILALLLSVTTAQLYAGIKRVALIVSVRASAADLGWKFQQKHKSTQILENQQLSATLPVPQFQSLMKNGTLFTNYIGKNRRLVLNNPLLIGLVLQPTPILRILIISRWCQAVIGARSTTTKSRSRTPRSSTCYKQLAKRGVCTPLDILVHPVRSENWPLCC
jgi:hypothetical protein